MKFFLAKALLICTALLPALPATVDAARPKPKPATKAADDTATRIRELEAEIAQRRQAYEKTHTLRRQRIGGEVGEKRFEQYLTSFRRKIACSSSLHYPAAARGKIYGDMIVTVSILADGSFEKATVDRSSGSRALDKGAIDIARLAAPYDPFPPEIRGDTDALDITRTWTFTHTKEGDGAEDPCA
ncbi:MAG: TonB family protein [Azoarcus sp.]|nr:TonB family protein [Azoarcus sp.]